MGNFVDVVILLSSLLLIAYFATQALFPEEQRVDELPKRKWTLHKRNVGKHGDIVTHWSSGPGNYTFDDECWWCRLKDWWSR